jgi:hypothetical protein
MSRAVLGRVALVLGGLVVGLLVAEGLARVVRPAGHADLLFDSPDASPEGLYVIDPALVLVPRPGFTGTIRSQGYRVPLTIDPRGLRAPATERTAASPWIAAGDSFTLSVQVPIQATFAERVGAATGRTVYNAGVDGYSTWQASRRAAALDAETGAAGVLLTFFLGNDLQDNDRFEHVQRTVAGRPAGAPIPRAPVSAIQRGLLRWSAIYAHLRVWRRARALRSGADPARKRWQDELAIFSSDGRAALHRLMPRTEAALREARDAARGRGDTLVVAVAPPAFVVHEERLASTFEVVGLDPATATPNAPGEAVRATLDRLGIRACDLTPDLRAAAGSGDALYFTYDGHWTARGHAVVADTLTRCLESDGR